MKKITTSIITSTLLFTGLNAFDLEYRLDSMEKKIHQLEKEKDVFVNLKSTYFEDIEDLENRTDEIETDTAINSKVLWGLSFLSNYNYFDVENVDGTDYQIDNFFRNRLELHLYSEISDNMTFDGTLSMYKNWSDNTSNFGTHYDDTMGTRPDTNTLSFTRAYVNWKKEVLKDLPMVLTFGRLPSTKGTNYDFQNDSVRQATFSALDFDGTSDGFIITALTDKLSGLTNSSIRFAFGKGYQFDEASPATASIPMNDPIKDTNVFGLFGEAAIPTYKNSMIQLGYVKAMDMIADPTRQDLGNLYGSMGYPVSANTANTNVGDLELISIASFIKNVNNSNWDIFAHYSHSKAEPSDTPFGGVLGLLSNGNDTSVKNGYAYWVGARYNFDNGWKIGAEYNAGSKYWLSFNRGSENIYNKLATRGNATEAYFLLPINRYAFFKFGYLNINYDYTNSSYHIGEPMKIENLPAAFKGSTVKTLNTYYFNLEVRF